MSNLHGLLLFTSEINEMFSFLPLSQRHQQIIQIWNDLSMEERNYYKYQSKYKLSSDYRITSSPIQMVNISNKINIDYHLVLDSNESVDENIDEITTTIESNQLSLEGLKSSNRLNAEGVPHLEYVNYIKRLIASKIEQQSRFIPENDPFIQRICKLEDIKEANETIGKRKRILRDFVQTHSPDKVSLLNINRTNNNDNDDDNSTVKTSVKNPRNVIALSSHALSHLESINQKKPDELNDITRRSRSSNNLSSSSSKLRLRSKYKGVTRKTLNSWHATIYFSKECPRMYLGRFDNEIDAAKEHDRVARLLRGENAVTNFSIDGKREFRAAFRHFKRSNQRSTLRRQDDNNSNSNNNKNNSNNDDISTKQSVTLNHMNSNTTTDRNKNS